jgi:DegV family protein with EDD domain
MEMSEMGFTIVTDSSANLNNEIIDQYDIQILSLMYRIGDKEYNSYIKGEKNDLAPLYTIMRNKENVTTSSVSPGVCNNIFDMLLKQGQDVLYLGFSSALSATYQTASITLQQLAEEYPERRVYCVDTLAASLGQGLLVTYAAKLKESGKTIEEVYNWVMENRLHLCHWFTVDDLFFLQRGGRVSKSTAIVGTLLDIKPVMHMDNEGRLIPVSKVRGRKKSLNALVDQMEKTAIHPESQMVYISHGDCLEDANYVKDQVRTRFGVKNFLIQYVEPVIGAHSGPGTVALFFIGSER